MQIGHRSSPTGVLSVGSVTFSSEKEGGDGGGLVNVSCQMFEEFKANQDTSAVVCSSRAPAPGKRADHTPSVCVESLHHRKHLQRMC